MADYQFTQTGASIQTLLNKIGTASLNTTATMLSNAINELDGNIGDLSSLTTAEKGSTVGAINELDGDISTNASAIGTLTDLTTTEKGSLVGAINEVVGSVGGVKGLKIMYGMESSVSFSANSYTDKEIAFGGSFTAEPVVFVGLRSSSTSTNMHLLSVGVLSNSVTTSGFTVRGWNAHTSAFSPSIYWLAVGV